MFGYVLPDKPELLVRDLETYRSVYCSLCYALRRYGVGAKLLLRYDFVFMALLQMSLAEGPPEYFYGRCNVNPLKKERLLRENDALRLSAAALILSSRHKFADDRRDSRGFHKLGAFFAYHAVSFSYRRAAARYPLLDREIARQMALQEEAERSGDTGLDRACEATSAGLGYMFSLCASDEAQSRILYRLGYMVGRFVYLADAADDLTDDLKRGGFNVLALRHRLVPGDPVEEALVDARAQMRLACGEAELCYRLLDPRYFTSILDNIIYKGLPAVTGKVGAVKKGRKNERSL